MSEPCHMGCPAEAYPTPKYRVRHWRAGEKPCESARRCRELYDCRIRKQLAQEQRWICPLCSKRLPTRIVGNVHVDHKVPASRGGGNDWGNLQAVHKRCNLDKGELTNQEHAAKSEWRRLSLVPAA